MIKNHKKPDEEVENPGETPLEATETEIAPEEPSNPPIDENAAKIAELTADLQRTRADFENFRKQVDNQRLQAMETATEGTLLKLLPLLDDIERGIASNPELSPLAKSFEKALKELKITKIDTKEGAEFNPDLHDAVLVEDGDGDREVIAETLRPGYFYAGQILRPAMVKVKRI